MEYKLIKQITVTPIPENKVYTRAIYQFILNNKNITYLSDFISITDIPYRRYKLTGGAYNESIICRRYS